MTMISLRLQPKSLYVNQHLVQLMKPHYQATAHCLPLIPRLHPWETHTLLLH